FAPLLPYSFGSTTEFIHVGGPVRRYLFTHKRLLSIVLMSCLSLSALPAVGQLGGVLGGKKKSDQPVKVSDQAPQYTDADKQKMAQLADRPDVKDEIDARWRAQRNEDLEFAYNVNSSAHFVDISGPAFAEFREKYGRLYNNPILQQYVNNIGQRLVPKDSNNVYSFK